MEITKEQDQAMSRSIDAHDEHRIESLKAGQCPRCKSSLCIEENPRNLTIKCDAECGWSARYPIRTIGNSERAQQDALPIFSVLELAKIREAILTALDDGTKSDTEEERFGFLGEGYRPWAFYAENWREDTEDSTSDRMRFLDAVQSLLTKKAQT